MRVFTIINGYTGALCLQELLDQGHDVVGVVTAPQIPSRASTETTVFGIATKHLLPLYMPAYDTVGKPSPEFVDLVRSANPDLIVAMHYPAIFKPVLLDLPPLGCVNIHPSRVPEGRGMTPSWWYLYLGRQTAWTALHYLDPGVDSGDVIAFGKTRIRPDDTGEAVSRRLSEAAHAVFAQHLPGIMSGTAPRTQQDLSKGSYLWSGKNWQEIRWKRGAKGIRGQIRCFTGTGNNARTFIGGNRLTINDAIVADANSPSSKSDGVPGEVLAITGQGPLVQTGKGQLILTDFAIDNHAPNSLVPLIEHGIPVILG